MKQQNIYHEMFEQRKSIANVLKVIAHETRLMVICLLAKNEMSVNEINSQIGVSQSVLSQHLAVLRKNHLVTTRRDSQTIYYQLADDDLIKIINALKNTFCK